jgi:hypothetical protein
MGIDIGGGVGADRSVIVVRSNKQLLAVFASEWHGVLDDARHRLEPVVVELARKWRVPAGQIVYDMAGIGRSFGSYLASHGLAGAVGHFGAGRGGKRYVNRRTANAFALRRRLDPHRDGFVPFGGPPGDLQRTCNAGLTRAASRDTVRGTFPENRHDDRPRASGRSLGLALVPLRDAVCPPRLPAR